MNDADQDGSRAPGRMNANYTAAPTLEPGAGSIVTGGSTRAFHRRQAHFQKAATDAGGDGGAG